VNVLYCLELLRSPTVCFGCAICHFVQRCLDKHWSVTVSAQPIILRVHCTSRPIISKHGQRQWIQICHVVTRRAWRSGNAQLGPVGPVCGRVNHLGM